MGYGRYKIRTASAVVATAALFFPLGATAAEGEEEKARPLSAEEVLAAHAEAKGGAEAWAEVETLRIEGQFTAFSETTPYTLERRRPAFYRFDTTLPDGERWTLAYDGELAWTVNPFAGIDWATESSAVEADVLARRSDFDGPLMGADPAAVKLSGPEDFDGELCYKLVLEVEGVEEAWYVSAETFLEFARIAPTEDFGRPIETGRTYFMDFREVEGLLIPHRIEKEYGIRHRVYDVTEVELNPEIPEQRFRFELSPAMAALAPMAGTFDVKLEWLRRPGRPWGAGTAEAVIEKDFHGALLTSDLSVVQDGQTQDLRFTWSWDRYRKLYLVTFFDGFTFRQDLLQGTMRDGALTVSDEATGTARVEGDREVLTRLTFQEIAEEGFKMVGETSRDGGTTWTEDQRWTFTRRR